MASVMNKQNNTLIKGNKNKEQKEYWVPEELWQGVKEYMGLVGASPNPQGRQPVQWRLFKELTYKDLSRVGLSGRHQTYIINSHKKPVLIAFNSDGTDEVEMGVKKTSLQEFKFNIRKQHLVGGFNHKKKNYYDAELLV